MNNIFGRQNLYRCCVYDYLWFLTCVTYFSDYLDGDDNWFMLMVNLLLFSTYFLFFIILSSF